MLMNPFNFFGRVFSFTPLEFPNKEDLVDVVEPENPILDLIYGKDPVTGLPTGDLAIYLSDKANAEVRLFIEQNLLSENVSTSSIILPSNIQDEFGKLSDEEVAFFSRSHDESREEYADRLKLYFANERKQRKQAAYLKHQQELAQRALRSIQ